MTNFYLKNSSRNIRKAAYHAKENVFHSNSWQSLKGKIAKSRTRKTSFLSLYFTSFEKFWPKEKKIKNKDKYWKEKIFVFVDHVLIYVENPKECGRKYQNLIKFRSLNPK